MPTPSSLSALLAVLLAFPLACSSSRGTDTQGQGTPPTASILVGGDLGNGTNLAALYWQDGTAVPLTSAASDNAWVNAMTVSGSDIYAVGRDGQATNLAALWVNGVESSLPAPPGVGSDLNTNLTGVAVSGTDVYVCGTVGNDDFNATAVYWKNGVPVVLGAGSASAICVQGSDVYVAGLEGVPQGSALYWKNGVAYGLGSTTGDAFPAAIAVNQAGDVLVAGTVVDNPNFVATLWTNGVPTPLADGSVSCEAWAMALSGTDVYVAGWVATGQYTANAVYWKDGVLTNLTGEEKPAWYQASAIGVDGVDVHVAGEGVGKVAYWKNGVETDFENASADAAATCLCILHP